MDQTISESIKQARVKAGLTQKDVEAKLSLRNLQMKDYETGRIKLPVEMAIKLAGLYKLSLDDLLHFSQAKNSEQDKVLMNMHSLFQRNGFELIFLDPIIKAFLESHQDNFFEHSLFDLLTFDFSESHKKDFILEVSNFLNSLMGVDGKISDSELGFVRYLLNHFGLKSKIKTSSKCMYEEYLPSKIPNFLSRAELKHFVVWLLFFMAQSDGEISYKEVEYIEKASECLKVNKDNYLYIKSFFVREKL